MLDDKRVSRRGLGEEDGDFEVIWSSGGTISLAQLKLARVSVEKKSKAHSPSTTTSLMAFFLVLFFLARSRSSRSLGSTSGRTLSMTRGSAGSRGFSSHDWANAGLSR